MELVIRNRVIDAELIDILTDLNIETSGTYFKNIKPVGDNIATNCPFHKDGQEKKPSCFIYTRKDEAGEVPFGFYKCFTCGAQGPLWQLVAKVLNTSYEAAQDWLIERYSSTYLVGGLNLPEIELGRRSTAPEYLDESILMNYCYTHPYMYKRQLTEEVINKFKIGFDPTDETITFPVWDHKGGLLGVTKRSVNTKFFHIPKDMDKPIYLLNYIIKENIKEVYVCESQINTLTLWGWGYPAIGLMGTGSKQQYEILKKSGIRIYHLCLDGDNAGYNGVLKFMRAMPQDVLIDVIGVPWQKDVNDLTREQFDALPRYDRSNY